MKFGTRFGARFGVRQWIRVCGVSLIAGLLLCAMPASADRSSDDAPAAASLGNSVLTADSARVRARGELERFRAYLSRSQMPLKSIGIGASAVFSDFVSQSGYYKVYAWWPQSVNGAGPAEIIIRHVGGESRVVVDQRVLGGQWNALGVFQFGYGFVPEIEFSASRGPFVLDALRIEYLGPDRPALDVQTTGLAVGQQGAPYESPLVAVAGEPPYRWRLVMGQLPAGVSLDEATGLLAGIPGASGEFAFTVEVTDAQGGRAERELTIHVARSTSRLERTPEPPTPDGAYDVSGLITILASMPDGGWARINLNNYSDVWTPADLRPLVGSRNPTPASIILPWSSFAWDSNRGVLWLYGGGHENYSGIDVYRFLAATRRWERASLPSEITQDDLGNWIAIDGPDAAPASAHTYDNTIFLPILDRLLVFGGAAYNNGGPFMRQSTPTTSRRTGPYLFDPNRADGNKVGGTTGSHVQRVSPNPQIVGGQMWSNRDLYLNLPSAPLPASHVNGCSAYAVENGKDVVYLAARSGGTATQLYRYVINSLANPSLDTWTQVGRNWNTQTNIPACGYDDVRKIFVKRGVNAQPFAYWNLNTPGPTNNEVAFTPIDPTGEFASLLSSGSLALKNCGLDFDGTRRHFVLWCGDARVWKLTPPATLAASGWQIQRLSAPAQAQVPNGDVGTGINGKWKFIDEIDAFIGLQDAVAGNIWLYRPHGWVDPGGGGTNAPPSVAITSPADGSTFNVGQPVTIAADAIDTDGLVNRVEFFRGSTKLGEDTTEPYEFTFTQGAPGAHVLTAIAFDDLGAQTTSAPVTVTFQGGSAATVTLRDGVNGYQLTRDTYLSVFHPSLTFGTAVFLYDQKANNYVPLVRFAIFESEGGPVPDGATIQSATLALYKETSYDMTYAVHRLLRNWAETGATWQQFATGQPWAVAGAGGSGSDYASVADAQAGIGWNPGWLQFDVTGAVQQMSAGQANFGWKLVPVSGYVANLKRFHARESQTNPGLRPTLTVSYSIASP